jgi:ABC-type glycerol-3-phosphate transport system permease component
MRRLLPRAVQLMLLILLALLVLTPLLWLVSTSLKGPAEDIFRESAGALASGTQLRCLRAAVSRQPAHDVSDQQRRGECPGGGRQFALLFVGGLPLGEAAVRRSGLGVGPRGGHDFDPVSGRDDSRSTS